MEKRNFEKVKSYYLEKFEAFGPNAKGADWKDEDPQLLSFKIMLDIGVKSGDSVLDVGSGYGAMYEYMLNKGLKVNYVGIELVPDMVEYARRTFKSARFINANFLEIEIKEEFDYVFACGPFHIKLDANDSIWWEEVVKPSILKMWKLCKKGIAFNMMTPYVDYRYERLFYPDISEFMKFIASVSKRFVMRHDYGLFMFTIYMWR